MSVAVGNLEYRLEEAPVLGTGISWTGEELDSALTGRVAEVIFDDEGTFDVLALLEGVPETDFDQTELRRVLETRKSPEDWRVGEAIAETYLVEHLSCTFPWPDGRDERKSGSSLPGADLVGIEQDGDVDRFAFGEVKTSGDASYPPGTMYGRTGLKQQLEDLRDRVEIRDDLVRYLAHRATRASWKTRFIDAYKRYNDEHTDVSLFGVLIRDVPPNHEDLRVRVSALGSSWPTGMRAQLLAVYLPGGRIETLGSKVIESRKITGP